MLRMFILSLVFIFLAIVLAVAAKVYSHTPAHELKRRAASKRQPAAKLFTAVAYGSSLFILLWGGIAVFGSLGLVLLARTTSVVISVPAIIAMLMFTFIWLPASRVTKTGTRVTLLITPAIVWVLRHFYPVLSRGGEQVEKRSPTPHTGLFERSDILKLIQLQADQQDSRLSIEELAIIQRALVFGDYQVRDIITPRSKVMTVKTNETLGPILIDELHKSETPFVLVKDSDDNTVGSLEIQKLGLKSSGPVSDHLSPIYYLHENDTLREALHAFFVTNYPLFVVVNSFEEYVGIITIESVLRQLLGHLPGDEFEQYSNIAAVAGRHPKNPVDQKS